jgi:alcohol sulfotransferase
MSAASNSGNLGAAAADAAVCCEDRGVTSRSLLGPGVVRGLRLLRTHYREIITKRSDDVIIVSYPKSGRTWQRVMLCHYINSVYLDQEPRSLNIGTLTRRAGIPRISYSHNGSNLRHALPAGHWMVGDPLIWWRRKIILLLRDPRDLLVSAYMHANNRSNTFSGSLSQFIRHPCTGIEKVLTTYQRWDARKSLASSVLVQTYEMMHRQPEAALRELLRFAGIPVDIRAVENAAEFARFDNLKTKEREGYFIGKEMRSGRGGEAGMKIRSGKVGGFADHMSGEDLDYIRFAALRIGLPIEWPGLSGASTLQEEQALFSL